MEKVIGQDVGFMKGKLEAGKAWMLEGQKMARHNARVSSRQETFRREYLAAEGVLRGADGVFVESPSGHGAYVNGATRQRVRALARRMAREKMRDARRIRETQVVVSSGTGLVGRE